MSVRLEDLRPIVMFKAKLALATLREKGEPAVVTSTLRTEAEQIALHAQGRKPLDEVNLLRAASRMRPISEAENRYTVTNCDGVIHKSNHQGGSALDCVPADSKGNPVWPAKDDPRWGWIAEAFKGQGFAWGGDWPEPKRDMPHYEYTGA